MRAQVEFITYGSIPSRTSTAVKQYIVLDNLTIVFLYNVTFIENNQINYDRSAHFVIVYSGRMKRKIISKNVR